MSWAGKIPESDLCVHPAGTANQLRLQEECEPGDDPGNDEDWSRGEDKR